MDNDFNFRYGKVIVFTKNSKYQRTGWIIGGVKNAQSDITYINIEPSSFNRILTSPRW